MFTAFSTALSGMAANSAAVDVISNNLANLNTAGFKATTAQFQEMMAHSLGGSNANEVGMGVGPVATTRIFTQGSIQSTGAPTNVAIQGGGFFVVKDQNNQTLFTRAGNFEIDQKGNLVTLSGESVQGWTAVAGVVNPNGAPANITIPGGAIIPGTATTKMSMGINLDASAATGAGGAFSAPINVVDSLGATHVLTATFTKTGPNAWSYAVTIPQADLGQGGTAQIATGNLTFDGAGKLTSPAATAAPVSLAVAGLADHANDMTVAWSLFDSAGNGLLTQLAQKSAISSSDQDGIAPGQIVKVAIQDGGLVVASYSNGLQATVAQLAVAAIRNPESLVSVGNNNLGATTNTAAAVIGAADTGGRGKIVGGALEGSTADIAREFTNLIVVQRSYQANSKVVTASDTLLQETVNLIR
jgi:flagellar hook protein FlgE